MDEDTHIEPADPRAWKAPQLTVLGTLKSVTEANNTQFGDNVPNQGPLPGSSGFLSS
jgi:hypothetical protein